MQTARQNAEQADTQTETNAQSSENDGKTE